MSRENLSKAVTCKDVLLAKEVLSKLQDPPTVFVGRSDNMYQGNNHTLLKHSSLFLRYHLLPDRQGQTYQFFWLQQYLGFFIQLFYVIRKTNFKNTHSISPFPLHTAINETFHYKTHCCQADAVALGSSASFGKGRQRTSVKRQDC